MGNTPALPFFAPADSPRAIPSPRHATPNRQRLNALRKFAQGAGSSLLVFSGANSITGDPATPITSDPSSLEGVFASFMNSDFAGPAQIIAAVLLFVLAGKSFARVAGLAVAAVLIFCYLNDISGQDVLAFAQRFVQRMSAAIHAFHTAEVS